MPFGAKMSVVSQAENSLANDVWYGRLARRFKQVIFPVSKPIQKSAEELLEENTQYDWCWDFDAGKVTFSDSFINQYSKYIPQPVMACPDFIAQIFEKDRAEFINSIYTTLKSKLYDSKINARLYDHSRTSCVNTEYTFSCPNEAANRKVFGTMKIFDNPNSDQINNNYIASLTSEIMSTEVSRMSEVIQNKVEDLKSYLDCEFVSMYSYEKLDSELTRIREFCTDNTRKIDVVLQNFSDHSNRLDLIATYEFMPIPNNVLDKTRQETVLSFLNCENVLLIPVKNKENYIGLMTVGFSQKRELSKSEMQFLRSIASVMYLAVDQLNSYIEIKNKDTSILDQQRIAKIGTWIKDMKTGRLTCSPEARAIFEIEDESEYSDFNHFMSIVHPDDFEHVSSVIGNAIQNDLEYDLTYRIITPSGNLKYINGRADALRDENGDVYQRIGTLADVSYIKRAESALQKSERRIRNLLNSTAEGVFGLNTDGECTFINNSALNILGFKSQTDLLGQKVCQLLNVNKEISTCDFSSSFRGGEEIHQDLFINNQDGKALRIELWAHPVVEAYGIDGCVVAFFDVTEKREAEERLKQSSAFFESTREGVIITDDHMNIIAVNRAFTTITGYEEDEVLGSKPSILSSGCSEPSFYKTMFDKINECGFWQGEIVNKRKNGEIYPEWLTINRVLDDHGAVMNYVGVFTDISPIKKNEEQIENISNYDLLTNLPNRFLLTEQLRNILDAADKKKDIFAVLLIDLDNFKNINDSLGHNVGDSLLMSTAQRLSEEIREDDMLARVGGDEFVIVAKDIKDVYQVENLANRILKLMSDPFNIDCHDLYVAASIGITMYPDTYEDATHFLSFAESAMYLAKEKGRNCYQFYDPELLKAAHERHHIENELRKALVAENELRLFYQPQVDIETGDIIGAEALIRWFHAKDGMMSPGVFLPAAEKAGLMAALDYWVIREACQQHAEWQKSGMPNFKLAINITKDSFMDKQFIFNIGNILEATDVNPNNIELEITEGALIEPSSEVMSTIGALKQMGFTLAVDDFGTGYSSLAYLQKFNVDKLKIDRSFVIDMLDDPQSEVITSTIISMAKNLHLDVLAEGVETEEQLELLRSKGCETYQGFYFSKPLAVEDFKDLMMNDE